MAKIYKPDNVPPRSLYEYERVVLEAMQLAEEAEFEDEEISPEQILAAARHEAERKVKEAYVEATRRGMEAGRAQYLKAVAESAGALRTAAEAMQKAREDFLTSLEPQVVRLAVAVARRILEREMQGDPDAIGRTVRKAITHLADRETMTLRLHPADLEGLRKEKVKLLDEFDGVREITLQADENVRPGGCIVETDLLTVDARIESQLEQIMSALERDASPEEPGSGNTAIGHPQDP
jgi:flagellar biosynthesis/type III secretory pathway protein FliH